MKANTTNWAGLQCDLIQPEVQYEMHQGEVMPVLGFVTYSVKIGDRNYNQEFIVIKQLVPEIILGRDFLSTYKLAITWGREGVLELRDEQEIAILMAEEITEYPAALLAKVEIPARMAVMVPVSVNLPPFCSQNSVHL